MNIIYFDTETNGLNANNDPVLSIGGIVDNWLDDSNYDSNQPYDPNTDTSPVFTKLLNWKLVNPNFMISQESMKVHGITDKILVQEGDHPLIALCVFEHFLETHNIDIMIAFNAPFDIRMLLSCTNYFLAHSEQCSSQQIQTLTALRQRLIGENGIIIDMLLVDRILNPFVNGIKIKHTQAAVGERLHLPIDKHAHDSTADAKRLKTISRILIKECATKRGWHMDKQLQDTLNKYDQYYKNRYCNMRNRKPLNDDPLLII